MKPAGIFALLFALTMIARTAVAAEAKPHESEELANFRAVAFSTVRSAEVARLAADRKGDFHGLKVISVWQELDAGSCAGLSGLLRQPIADWVRAYASAGEDDLVKLEPFCVPDYGYAVRLETDQGMREFAICLRCGQILAFGDRKRGADFSVKDEALVRLKAYYLDEFVLNQGRAKKP